MPPHRQAEPSGAPRLTRSFEDSSFQPILTETWIRLIFLTLAIVAGAVTAYTTRHFVNGDALTYFDMAGVLATRHWADLVNLHYSPGYAVLLGVADALFPRGLLDEVSIAKAVNFFCFLATLLSLELLLGQLKADEEWAPGNPYQHIDWVRFRAAVYGLFLLCSLVYVRIQVISPDMLEFCFALLAAAVLVRIKRSSDSLASYLMLGLAAGAGYLCKTPFFVMGFVFIALSALYAASISKALTRICVTCAIFLVVGSAVWGPISHRLGRLSFGESGNFNYTYFVARQGEPVHVPEKIWDNPAVQIYAGGSPAATYPRGFDLAYWNEGIKPLFDLRAQVSVLAHNVAHVMNLNPTLHVLFVCWICLQVPLGATFSLQFLKPSLAALFGIIGLVGTGLFCPVLVEARYVAPYVFIGLVGVLLWPRYGPDGNRARKAARAGITVITVFSIGTAIVSIWDQSNRSLHDAKGKRSHRSIFMENTAVENFLRSRGIVAGDRAAIVGEPSIGLYWARLGRLKAMATISDSPAFAAASHEAREGAVHALRDRQFKVVLGTGKAVAGLAKEGWLSVPGTRDTHVLLLQ